MSSVASFNSLVLKKGAPVLYHREQDSTPCPCVTDEGFRDPIWHRDLEDAFSATANLSGSNAQEHSVSIYVIAKFGDVELAPFTQNWTGFFDLFALTLEIDWSKIDPSISEIRIYRSDDTSSYRLIGTITLLQGLSEFTHTATVGTLSSEIYDVISVPQECNAHGMIPIVTELVIRGFVQPVFGNIRGTQNTFLIQSFGAIQVDDQIGIFPTGIFGIQLNFRDWSNAGNEYLEFRGRRYNVVSWNEIPAPEDGSLIHHYECALRRINQG